MVLQRKKFTIDGAVMTTLSPEFNSTS